MSNESAEMTSVIREIFTVLQRHHDIHQYLLDEIDNKVQEVSDALDGHVGGEYQRVTLLAQKIDSFEQALRDRADTRANRSQLGRWGVIARLRAAEERIKALEEYNGIP